MQPTIIPKQKTNFAGGYVRISESLIRMNNFQKRETPTNNDDLGHLIPTKFSAQLISRDNKIKDTIVEQLSESPEPKSDVKNKFVHEVTRLSRNQIQSDVTTIKSIKSLENPLEEER